MYIILFYICCINESKEVLSNVAVVKNAGYTKCPILLFVSNGKQTQGYWAQAQKEFATMLDAKLISFECGHYIHHFKSDETCKEINEFVNSLER